MHAIARIHLIAAARPNFMKIAPLYHALKRESWAEPVIVHTGQHYDPGMSGAFFQDLELPAPHFHLGVGSGTHAEQTGRVMIEYEKLLAGGKPSLVVVVGDVNSTAAATLTAAKMGVKVAHLEAGLRSFDRTMPEEINRIVTDALADLLWTPSRDADANLLREGVPEEKIRFVGNIMIDSLEIMRLRIDRTDAWRKYGLERGRYGLVTLHRPSNVDGRESLERLCSELIGIGSKIPLIFPVHPRTRKNLEATGLMTRLKESRGISIEEPISYVPFMNMVFNCRFAITDSGGIQEETTYLGIPCLTLRPNTERPITVTEGTNRLIKPEELGSHVHALLENHGPKGKIPELWDGHTAERVVKSIHRFLFEDRQTATT
ncbi:MAG: UDP-N-acetylglucosamine 2-epimerase (non-hydrolyzing) [Deltaproteobacteria bacterium HGW-Deltaproteobacteria-21]|nr:MAG: UDP-N-acetylglucosamine 2-epimerase (non-hydrolyzing) [Deltaproteobacteria bacterium HGW-Deltaproteobacteria-21]